MGTGQRGNVRGPRLASREVVDGDLGDVGVGQRVCESPLPMRWDQAVVGVHEDGGGNVEFSDPLAAGEAVRHGHARTARPK